MSSRTCTAALIPQAFNYTPWSFYSSVLVDLGKKGGSKTYKH